ncbi:hypothetical protein FH972_025016 [Carpinus fangiana]|uniref:alanine--glyoxylate transaminase n=1 Tax=Carpinus fangiana TaxID=176857 RepID=A0A5N6L018_9ROSI|nr:hypothetical protein FH972_025016 [Carpinus fangiana]
MAPGTLMSETKDLPNTTASKILPGRIKQQESALLHRSLHKAPLEVVSASGHYLTTADGRRILDSTCGAAVACLGHGNERVHAAILKQLNTVAYANSLIFTSTAPEELSRFLVDSTHGHMARAYILSSGSEAMETAMKLARQYFMEKSTPESQRINFIARRESYHGTTLGSLSMGGHVARRALFEPMLLKNVTRVSQCNAYRGMSGHENTESYVARLAQELDDEFQRIGPDTVCAFVAEPVVGAATGCVPAVEGYFRAMREVCDRYGALLILDEVMSGMGRCGTLHEWEQEEVVPDIQTMAKGLGGGFAPVAAVMLNHRIVDQFIKGSGIPSHGMTYQAHPVACAAALEVQRIVQEEDLLANVRKMGTLLGQLMHEQLDDLPYVGNVRGKGLFWGVEFVRDKVSKEPFDPTEGVGIGIHELALEEPFSLSLYPGAGSVDGRRGDHIMLAPAYNVTEAEVRHIVDLTAATIKKFFEAKDA